MTCSNSSAAIAEAFGTYLGWETHVHAGDD
jgi:hypothetical protein